MYVITETNKLCDNRIQLQEGKELTEWYGNISRHEVIFSFDMITKWRETRIRGDVLRIGPVWGFQINLWI